MRCQLTRLFLAAGMVVSLVAGSVPSLGAAAQTAPASVPTNEHGMPEKVYFPETGHNLGGALLRAWNSTGLMIIGYPISEPAIEGGRTVQYFERARLEVWPEHAGTQWEVQGTLLGSWATRNRRNEPAFRRLPSGTASDSPERVIFPETGHSLSYAFKRYWETHGGLWQFGYPISEEFVENGFTVQYFERARFEYHPEHAGTQYEVLLGLLGHDYASYLRVSKQATQQASDAVRYDASLFDWGWTSAFRPSTTTVMGMVATDALGVRSTPDTSAEPVDVIYFKRPIEIQGIVRGSVVEGHIDAWYVVGPGRYVSAAYVDPLVLRTPPQTYGGHWVDVNLTQFYATAYDGSTPVYVAIIAAGRDGKTPLGVFNIMYQVRNETMDSATVGIPPGAPGYYYLENVEFTQYFLDGGYAIHGNYWTPEARFGNFTSNGCVGLMNQDAEVFWNWLDIGDVVSIHY
jgi:lipoprotein-anchoring transpeptidase ErfK/SrfK